MLPDGHKAKNLLSNLTESEWEIVSFDSVLREVCIKIQDNVTISVTGFG